MRKECGILVLILITATLNQISADEFETKSKYDPYNPLVQQIALELNKETDLETAKAIWEWMNENIKYEYFPESCNVEYTLTVKQGNCSNHSTLAASLLLACGLKTKDIRICSGKNPREDSHAWVEIYTDRWHRFDSVHTHSFEYEYSLPIYQEGKDYSRIGYYYYDPRELPEISLKDSKTDLAQDIHIITLEIENSGGMRKYMKIEVMTDLEIVGSSHDFEILISPGETVTTKVFLRGEGKAVIEIGEIRYETELFYEKIGESQPIVNSKKEEMQIGEFSEESSSKVKSKEPVEVKKITIPESTENVRALRIDTASTKNRSFTQKDFIPAIALLFSVVAVSTAVYKSKLRN